MFNTFTTNDAMHNATDTTKIWNSGIQDSDGLSVFYTPRVNITNYAASTVWPSSRTHILTSYFDLMFVMSDPIELAALLHLLHVVTCNIVQHNCATLL